MITSFGSFVKLVIEGKIFQSEDERSSYLAADLTKDNPINKITT
jgi:hypothetical protein